MFPHIREIRQGEEITENYGLTYTKDPIEFRRRICTAHYGFECACVACENKWPERAVLSLRHSCKKVILFWLFLTYRQSEIKFPFYS